MNRGGRRGGGGGWKQYGGRGRGRGGHGGAERAQSSTEDSGDNYRGGGGGRGSRPPAHLRGRDIGMFYAQKSREQMKEREEASTPLVEIDSTLSSYLSTLLGKMKDSSSNVAPNEQLLESLKQTNKNSSSAGESSSVALTSELFKNPRIDESLQEELNERNKNSQYQRMLNFRKTLPSFKCKEEILQSIASEQVVVISGETGCGKTTQIGQYILDDMIAKGNGSNCNILCTQPRRISAVSVAERVAEERCERVGSKSVGYVIRLENRAPARRKEGGAITFCTTGIVFQYLRDDPRLKHYSHVIVDEVHERETNADILMGVLKNLISIRPDLKIILMSATINAEHFSKYFANCPMFSIPGMTFPVTEYYLEDIIEETKFQFEEDGNSGQAYHHGRQQQGAWWDSREYESYINKYVQRNRSKYSESTMKEILNPQSERFESLMELSVALLKRICSLDKDLGAVLIFLTGWDEISKLNSYLETCGSFPENKFLILPLHSMMPTINQRQIFERPAAGKRKIVIATNIAETSITIDDVVHVIDFGKIKMTNFDLNRNVESLDTEWNSRANAKQRRGRAGRVQEGYCYHLFSKARESTFEDFKLPEVKRKRLEEVILQLKILQLGDIRTLFKKLLDPPTQKAVDLSFDRLIQLHALDSDENLTPLGYHLSNLPMDPHTGKMILMGAVFSCIDPVFSVAASLSFKEPFYMPLGKEKQVDRLRKEFSEGYKSDHWVVVKAIEGFENAKQRNGERDYCFRNFLSISTCNMLVNFKKQFSEHLQRMQFLPSSNYKDPKSNLNASNVALVKAVICSGLYPNVARIIPKFGGRGPPFPTLKTPEDGPVTIHKKSVNAEERDFECPFVIYHQKQKLKKITLFDATMISPYPLIFFGGKLHYSVIKKVPTVSVDGSFHFRISKEHFEIVQELRTNLNKLLGQKVQNPSPTDWNPKLLEGELLVAIRDLITAQYNQIMKPEAYSSDEDDD